MKRKRSFYSCTVLGPGALQNWLISMLFALHQQPPSSPDLTDDCRQIVLLLLPCPRVVLAVAVCLETVLKESRVVCRPFVWVHACKESFWLWLRAWKLS
jgi:hypothetical protein